MKRALAVGAVVAICGLAAATSAFARTTLTTSCPATGVLVAGVTYSVTGEPVPGADGHVWAVADYTRTLAIYKVRNQFCAQWRDVGTFTTIDAASPCGSGHVDAGIGGTFNRSNVTTNFDGTWRPSKPTSGNLGTYQAPVDWPSWYFESVRGRVGLVWWTGMFQTLLNGRWIYRTGAASACDITS